MHTMVISRSIGLILQHGSSCHLVDAHFTALEHGLSCAGRTTRVLIIMITMIIGVLRPTLTHAQCSPYTCRWISSHSIWRWPALGSAPAHFSPSRPNTHGFHRYTCTYSSNSCCEDAARAAGHRQLLAGSGALPQRGPRLHEGALV